MLVIATLNIAQNSVHFGTGIILFTVASMMTSREYRARKSTRRKRWQFIGLHLLYLLGLIALSAVIALV